MPEPIRVVVADDHPVVRSGLASLFGTLEGIVVVAEAENGEAAIRETAIHRPDVVVMDLRMPGTDGVAATLRITTDFPETAVLVLTMYDEDTMIAAAISAGARGYLLKGADQAEIERAIRAVSSGDAIFSREVAERVIRRVTPNIPALALPQLTAREREVTELLAEGLSNSSIAGRLALAPKTVGNHISSIFLKLGVATRAEAIVFAREAGLGGHERRSAANYE